MKLIIIAAGTGSRMMPLTQTVPKPLLTIDTNTTILEKALKEVYFTKDLKIVQGDKYMRKFYKPGLISDIRKNWTHLEQE